MYKTFRVLCLTILLLPGLSYGKTRSKKIVKPIANAKILTYNVLADSSEKRRRLGKLFKILRTSKADIIALQEVSPWFVKRLKRQRWFKKYYTPRYRRGRRKRRRIIYDGGLLILSKKPIKIYSMGPLPGYTNRTYLIVRTKIRNVNFTIATCHLESPLDAFDARARQLDFFFDKLAVFENAILLGDFNFGDHELPETNHLPNEFVDVWRITNGFNRGYTWNIEKNPMAKSGSFVGETSRRLDRILIKSKRVKPIKTKIIGNKPVKKHSKIFPSDHFGILSWILIEKIDTNKNSKSKR